MGKFLEIKAYKNNEGRANLFILRAQTIRYFPYCLILLLICLFIITTNTPAHAAQLQISLKQGWNKVSFPLQNISSLGDTSHLSSTLFHYNSDSESYDLVPVGSPGSLQPGFGYWIQADQDVTITVTGDDVSASQTGFHVKQGWNQFGLPYNVGKMWGGITVSLTPPAG